MNPHSAAVARCGNPLKSRFESEIRAKIFSKSADPFTYLPPSINVGKIWKLLYCFYALMYLIEKILIMGFIERSSPRVGLEYRYKGPFECKLFFAKKLCTCVWNLKHEDAHLQTQNLGENLWHWKPNCIAFLAFNVLETWRQFKLIITLLPAFSCRRSKPSLYGLLYKWFRRRVRGSAATLAINLGIVNFIRKIIKRFLNYREICGRRPNCIQKMITKATERRLNKFSFFLEIGQSVPPLFSYTVWDGNKPLQDDYFSRPHHFL